MYLKNCKQIFFPAKSWKKHPQKLLRIPQIHFFPLLPWLPKRPKQKNSCSKMWPIDQLYIELGLNQKNLLLIYTILSLWYSISHNVVEHIEFIKKS